MLNSTIVQDLAETLPPGYLRKEELQDFGIPFVPELVEEVGAATTALAELVLGIAKNHSRHFPELLDALRSDPALDGEIANAWLAVAGPKTSWGPLSKISWIEDISSKGSLNTKAVSVTTSRELLGAFIVIAGSTGAVVAVHLKDRDDPAVSALAAYFRGAVASGRKLSEILRLPAPINAKALIQGHATVVASLEADREKYLALRERIDRAVEDAL